MPWYEPCASNGYSKFYSAPQLREDRFIVSDNYLQALCRAYRQAYTNAGGPDYEDSDDVLLDILASNCVGGTSDAASLGERHAQRDRDAGQDYHPPSLPMGGAIPSTPPTGVILPTQTQEPGTVYTAVTNPQGQPGENPVFSPSISLQAPGTSPSAPTGGFVPSSTGKIPWLLIAAAGAALYFFTRKG